MPIRNIKELKFETLYLRNTRSRLIGSTISKQEKTASTLANLILAAITSSAFGSEKKSSEFNIPI
ncbi:hypothetical protein MCEKH37_01179 [Methylophilaceae bacterium]